MSNRNSEYGPGLKILLAYRKMKRNMPSRGRRPRRRSGSLVLNLLNRLVGLGCLMVGGGFVAMALGIFLGSFSLFLFVAGGVMVGAGVWFFGGPRHRPRRSVPRPVSPSEPKKLPAPKPAIKDPRWPAAKSLLIKTKEAAKGDARILEAVGIIDDNLKSSFMEKQNFSAEDLGTISSDSADVNSHKEEIEGRIEEGLETLKKLYFSTIKRQRSGDSKAADEDAMDKVKDIMTHLDAEQEVDLGFPSVDDLKTNLNGDKS